MRDALSLYAHLSYWRVMRYTYHTEQWLPHPLENVFEFFADPENLPLLMPEWQDAHVDDEVIVPPPLHPEPVARRGVKAAGNGSRVTLSFLPFPHAPFRIHWVAEISEFAWNERFCDRQISGPFAYWHHRHSVRQATRSNIGGTLIADDVEYELPYGAAGALAHWLVLRRQIEESFFFRHIRLATLLSGITFPRGPS
jgi:ligand-binding SRPBCC domain-containing protein